MLQVWAWYSFAFGHWFAVLNCLHDIVSFKIVSAADWGFFIIERSMLTLVNGGVVAICYVTHLVACCPNGNATTM